MSLFARKPLRQLLEESADTEHGLKKTLSAGALVALGVGAVIGAGLFSITGLAAAHHAGPAITLSFVIAGLGCAFAGLCYSEFASMIPVAGSAYTYSYATLGEFIAWIIGWDLVLEYAVGAATVASSWSGYLEKLLESLKVALPHHLLMTPFDSLTLKDGTIVHGVMNLPAVFIVVLISLVLIRGTRESSWLNNIIVILKVGIVIIFIAVGFHYIRPENLTPYIPPNTGKFGDFGWSGIIRAAAIVFFAYIGFDAVSTAAQETHNPKKAMPIGILGALAVCTVLYVLFAYVMTGVADYRTFAQGGNELAPVATAIDHMGPAGPGGVVTPAYPWLNRFIIIAILLGYSSVILVMLLGQSRVFYSMSKDGLLPRMFSELHPKFRTPARSNLLFMALVSIFAAFVPGRVVGEMTSIGTLLAFILVCVGIMVMRRTLPDAPRGFRTPLVPLVPILGILVCFGMMVFLPLDTWIRLIAWMMIGFDIYLSFGIRRSHLAGTDTAADTRKSIRTTSLCGMALCLLLALITVLLYLMDTEQASLILFAVILCLFHLVWYLYYYLFKGRKAEA
jgi:APA family basic amino acid/polyamine antiporter